MSAENASEIGATPALSTKAWTAYVGLGIIAVALLFIVVPLAWSASRLLGACVLFAACMLIAYRFLSLRKVRLFMNDEGVWVESGILPWNRGVSGVKWRDLDEAVYFTGFSSWLFKSYSIRIGHRFTKSSEILMPHMTRGDAAVMAINERHGYLVRNDNLT